MDLTRDSMHGTFPYPRIPIGQLWRVLDGTTSAPVFYACPGSQIEAYSSIPRDRGHPGLTVVVVEVDETGERCEPCYKVLSSGHGIRWIFASWFDGDSIGRVDE